MRPSLRDAELLVDGGTVSPTHCKPASGGESWYGVCVSDVEVVGRSR